MSEWIKAKVLVISATLDSRPRPRTPLSVLDGPIRYASTQYLLNCLHHSRVGPIKMTFIVHVGTRERGSARVSTAYEFAPCALPHTLTQRSHQHEMEHRDALPTPNTQVHLRFYAKRSLQLSEHARNALGHSSYGSASTPTRALLPLSEVLFVPSNHTSSHNSDSAPKLTHACMQMRQNALILA